MTRSFLVAALVTLSAGCASVVRDGYVPIQWHKNTVISAEIRKLNLPAGVTTDVVGFKYFDGTVYRLYAPDETVQGASISSVIYVKWHKTTEKISKTVVSANFCDVYAPDPPLLPGKGAKGTYHNDQWTLLGMAIKQCFNEEAKIGKDWDTLGHEFKHAVDGSFHD